MKIKKSDLLSIIKEEAVKLYKAQLKENQGATEVAQEEPREKQDYEKNVFPEYGENLTEIVGQMREVVTNLEDMKLKQEAHGKLIPEGSERTQAFEKAKDILEKAANAADGFAKKLNKISIVMLRDME